MTKKPVTTKAAVAQLNLPLQQTVTFGLRIGPNRINQTVDWIGPGAPIERPLRRLGASWQAGKLENSASKCLANHHSLGCARGQDPAPA
jgi:hypothetical protein